MLYNIAIIGAGPAGISCAIQLKRQGLNPIIFEKNEVGGLLRNANLVENYPGFPDGISGIELVKRFNNHLKEYEISPVLEDITSIKFNENLFEMNAKYRAKFLVIASGTKPKTIHSPAFYEVTELFKKDLKNKKVAIIGSGDAAFDYALNIANNSEAKETVIINRASKTKCLPLLKERALNNTKIKYLQNTELNAEIEHDYVLAAIGREPNLDFLQVAENKKLFFIGDVKNGDFRQTAIAVGDGIKAAMEINANLPTLP